MMKKQTGTKRIIFISAGVICVVLGAIGIVLPVLPTTPFLLLAAFLFFRSSERFYNWLLDTKILGEYIRNYREYRAIKRKTKIYTIILLWATLGISIWVVDNIYIRIFLLVVGISVTVHILLIKTFEKIEKD
ncbi:MAG: YbaN family protein [Clostridia bacterium]|nr:YbaN family protein [Clostridia bacterium]